ncbi:MAG: PRC-barrel domain-containing protein [Paracoccaceae bacterium]
MQRILATTAVIALGAPVLAQDGSGMSGDDDLMRARDILGGNVYTMAEADEWETDMRFDGVDEGWSDVGEIEDIVLDQDGEMVGVVAEVGGFLDIGDKHVMLELASVKLVPEGEANHAVVTNLSQEELRDKESVDEGWWE